MHPLRQKNTARMVSALRAGAWLCLAISVALPGFASAAQRSEGDLADLLELRGYTRIGGTLEFSVHNKDAKRSEWLRVGEAHQGYKIESYDPETNTIVLRYNGQVGELLLQASRIADYVEPEPVPQAKEDSSSSAVPPRPGVANERRDASRPQTNRPGRAQPPPPNRQESGRERERSPAFMSRASSSPSPSPPSSPPDKNPGEKQEAPDDSYWARHSSPPPLPKLPPPAYSPKE